MPCDVHCLAAALQHDGASQLRSPAWAATALHSDGASQLQSPALAASHLPCDVPSLAAALHVAGPSRAYAKMRRLPSDVPRLAAALQCGGASQLPSPALAASRLPSDVPSLAAAKCPSLRLPCKVKVLRGWSLMCGGLAHRKMGVGFRDVVSMAFLALCAGRRGAALQGGEGRGLHGSPFPLRRKGRGCSSAPTGTCWPPTARSLVDRRRDC